MSNLTLSRTSPGGSDMKSSTPGSAPRQQGVHEVNKRRTFLQDNSWIKNRPEEEKKTNDRDEPKATISRYRSDDTLDRISDRSDAAKTHKANTLDNQLTNRSMSRFRSPEATKSQPGSLFNPNITNATASTSAAAPVKKKRQSWFPPPPPGYSTTPSTGTSRREPAVHPPIPPKPSSPVSSPNQLRQDNRQICPPKPHVYTETNRFSARNSRSLDLDKIVKVATTPQKMEKGKELDNLIKMNKSLNRYQGLDGLFRANPKAEKRAKSLENLIHVNTRTDRDGKGTQTLGSFIKENPRTAKNDKGSQDFETKVEENTKTDKTSRGHAVLDNVIKMNPKGNENTTRSQSLDNFIKVTPEGNRSNQGSTEFDELIKVNPRTEKSIQGGQSLDNLIKVVPETNRTKQGNQDQDNLIQVIPSANKSSGQGLDIPINVNSKTVNTSSNQELDKLIKVNPETLKNNQRNQDLDNLIKVNPAVIRSNQRLDGQINGFTNTPNNQSTGTTAYSYETRSNISSDAGTRHTEPKETVVYTRTYVENSKSPKDGYQETSSGKYIQTVYSTSDRSVIERDMCTYCRKPLGTETKMILDELQICCHSTCFKCEICKQPLENLQAGDSIWIYKQTIHCEPCYSKVMAKRIQ
ncbi:sciellin isoform X5 [Tamandua tetradactyla]|uniref:sciellin isoform X5 n=1 Tax=Tamandua tetradactyla TaxID=48850 RepID=UPI0040541152